MKVVVVTITSIILLMSNSAAAQNVDDKSTPEQSNSDVKQEEPDSELSDEIIRENSAEAVDKSVDGEKSSLELSDVKNLDDDAKLHPTVLEEDLVAHDTASDFSDDVKSESEDSSAVNQQPAIEFPSPFDPSMVDPSQVEEVANFATL